MPSNCAPSPVPRLGLARHPSGSTGRGGETAQVQEHEPGPVRLGALETGPPAVSPPVVPRRQFRERPPSSVSNVASSFADRLRGGGGGLAAPAPGSEDRRVGQGASTARCFNAGPALTGSVPPSFVRQIIDGMSSTPAAGAYSPAIAKVPRECRPPRIGRISTIQDQDRPRTAALRMQNGNGRGHCPADRFVGSGWLKNVCEAWAGRGVRANASTNGCQTDQLTLMSGGVRIAAPSRRQRVAFSQPAA